MNEMQINELKAKRMNMVTEMRKVMDANASVEISADDKTTLQNYENSIDAIDSRIVAEEKLLARERAIGEVTKSEPAKSSNTELFLNAIRGDQNAIAEYKNAMSLGVDATAGYLTAPVEFNSQLIRGLDNLLFMRQISNVVGPIGNAQSLGYPYRKTEAADGTWLAEVTTAAEETTLDFGRREFKPNKMAKVLKISNTLLSHSSMAEATLLREMQYKIGTGAEAAYMTGDGTAKPLGIFTASASGISTARDVSTDNTATSVTFDGLMNAKYNVKQQYLANASWVGHRDLFKQVAKIKDGDGLYVWQPSVIVGQPDRLLGAPVYMSEYAPNTFTTGLYTAVFGDFKQGYWICDAENVMVQMLKELFALTNQTGMLVHYFGDGAPVLEEAFSRVKLG